MAEAPPPPPVTASVATPALTVAPRAPAAPVRAVAPRASAVGETRHLATDPGLGSRY
jgi:hypothetical protein